MIKKGDAMLVTTFCDFTVQVNDKLVNVWVFNEARYEKLATFCDVIERIILPDKKDKQTAIAISQ